MEINVAQFNGHCDCGKTHSLKTKIISLESGATRKFAEIAEGLTLKSGGCIICDSNTKPFADYAAEQVSGILNKTNPVIMLQASDVHADEQAVIKVGEVLPQDVTWLVAAGSGTIHDVTRYIAKQRNIPFISYPTAASVDGYVSTVCAMTWNGFKKTMPGVAPVAVIADTDIFSKAPYRLTASGIADVLGKYTALADWLCGKLLTGEEFCERIYANTKIAIDNAREYLPAIHAGDADAYEKLMYSLLLSGISIQMWGDSRPASGSEHHLSHFWEMGIINDPTDALHGEKVGVGLLICLRYYEKIGMIADIEKSIRPYDGMPLPLMRKKFGAFYEEVLKENQPDPLRSISGQKVIEAFPELKRIISGLPEARKLRPAMQAAGCITTLEDIGLDRDIIPDSVMLAPFVRKRLTIMRASKLFTI